MRNASAIQLRICTYHNISIDTNIGREQANLEGEMYVFEDLSHPHLNILGGIKFLGGKFHPLAALK